MDPLASVLKSCTDVVEQLSSSKGGVSIVDAAIDSYAKEIVQQCKSKPGEQAPNVFTSFNDGGAVEWETSGIHYSLDVAALGPLTVQYIFVLDAMNFCFWPSPGFEYDTLALALKQVLEKDPSAFSAANLANMAPETLAAFFPTDKPIPNILERVDRLREVGTVLSAEFGGLAANMVKAANGSAVSLVKLILMHFPGFRDTVVYKGRLVHFYKRAQILVADIWGAYGRPRDPSHPYCFSEVERITMFADYRVPQILRHVGILQYDPELAAAVDAHQEVPFGSNAETEIRACTVVAVERLQRALGQGELTLLALEVDWLLWQRGEDMKDRIAPHHRTLTIYY